MDVEDVRTPAMSTFGERIVDKNCMVYCVFENTEDKVKCNSDDDDDAV